MKHKRKFIKPLPEAHQTRVSLGPELDAYVLSIAQRMLDAPLPYLRERLVRGLVNERLQACVLYEYNQLIKGEA